MSRSLETSGKSQDGFESLGGVGRTFQSPYCDIESQLRDLIKDTDDESLTDQIVSAALSYRRVYEGGSGCSARILLTQDSKGTELVYLEVINHATKEIRIIDPKVFEGPITEADPAHRYQFGFTMSTLLEAERIALRDISPLSKSSAGGAVVNCPHIMEQLDLYLVRELPSVISVIRSLVDGDNASLSELRHDYVVQILDRAGRCVEVLSWLVDKALEEESDSTLNLKRVRKNADQSTALGVAGKYIETVYGYLADNRAQAIKSKPIIIENNLVLNKYVSGVTRIADALQVVQVEATASVFYTLGISKLVSSETVWPIIRFIKYTCPDLTICVNRTGDQLMIGSNNLARLLEYAARHNCSLTRIDFDLDRGTIKRVLSEQKDDIVNLEGNFWSIKDVVEQALKYLSNTRTELYQAGLSLAKRDLKQLRQHINCADKNYITFERLNKITDELVQAEASKNGAVKLAGVVTLHDAKSLKAKIKSYFEHIQDQLDYNPLTTELHSMQVVIDKSIPELLRMLEVIYRVEAYLAGEPADILVIDAKTEHAAINYLSSNFTGVNFILRYPDRRSDEPLPILPADALFIALQSATNMKRYANEHGCIIIEDTGECILLYSIDEGPGFPPATLGAKLDLTCFKARFKGRSSREGGGNGNCFSRLLADRGMSATTLRIGEGVVSFLDRWELQVDLMPVDFSDLTDRKPKHGTTIVYGSSYPSEKPLAAKVQQDLDLWDSTSTT